jgi:hypothetical protein
MIGNGYCRLQTTLFSALRSLTQRTCPSFLGVMNVGDAHSLSPAGSRTPISQICNSSFLNVSRCHLVLDMLLHGQVWHPRAIRYVL